MLHTGHARVDTDGINPSFGVSIMATIIRYMFQDDLPGFALFLPLEIGIS